MLFYFLHKMRWTREESCCLLLDLLEDDEAAVQYLLRVSGGPRGLSGPCGPCGPRSPCGPHSPCGPRSPCGPPGPSRSRWCRRGGGSLQFPPWRCSPPLRYPWRVCREARLAGPKACLPLWPPLLMYFRQVFLAGPQTQEILFKSPFAGDLPNIMYIYMWAWWCLTKTFLLQIQL